jgi:hypothetical protein
MLFCPFSARDMQDNLAVQALVWLSTVQFGASYANFTTVTFLSPNFLWDGGGVRKLLQKCVIF